MKKQVMTAAWAIAKEAAAKHGGSSKQYLSEAMKQAWAQAQAQAPVEEVAAVEVAVVVEAAPKAKKAPKKKAPKKKTGGMDFGKWMRGITEHYQVESTATPQAPKKPEQPTVRKTTTETAAEKKARRAANPEAYAPVKVAPKAKKNGVGVDFGYWMAGITENL